jgi:hypothetical protein
MSPSWAALILFLIADMTQAKVQQLHQTAAIGVVREHDVAWLDVAMDEAAFMRRRQHGADLRGDVTDFAQRQGALVLDVVVQRLAFQILHHQEELWRLVRPHDDVTERAF